jgi:diaminohydroxyphosphoribosylaminopyrimidine deaminase/5-amino-6-(5-phosphoribosylamino)uracil reductase
MKQAIRLARKGMGTTSPNPLVGAIIVKNEKVIGKGYHKRKGEPHAEIMALKKAGQNAKGATLYVNLEPCVHWGATPPCVDAIIEAGIGKVYISIIDPIPLVNGKGVEKLRKANIDVEIGLCEAEAKELNEIYLKYIRTKLPFVILKAAITLDGKIATREGASRWITSAASRKFVHKLRSIVDGVIVGVGTVITDNPSLTVRAVKGRNPFRIVMDTDLRTPIDSNILGDKCVIATIDRAPKECITTLAQKAKLWLLPKNRKGKVDIKEVMKKAGEECITSILIEGGEEIFTSALASNVVDKVYMFVAPKILGDGIPFTKLSTPKLENAVTLHKLKYKRIGDDVLITGYIK